MPSRLRREEIVTIQVLHDTGQGNTQIAQTLGVTEGDVRYHLGRAASGAADGRQNQVPKAAAVAEVIAAWHADHGQCQRPVNIEELYEHLLAEHGYTGSYKSVWRYVRRHYPPPKIRTFRRVETPPGAQTQTDWGEFPHVDVGQGSEPWHAFVMVLSHSRKPAVVWSRSEDQLHWLACHNEAYRRLGGVAAVNRIDNLKTGIIRGAGAWGTINDSYRSYARAVGFHIDACPPRQGNAKGKVEAKVRLGRLRIDPTGKRFDSAEELQQWSDRQLEAWSQRATCPATGQSVQTSWEQERERLTPLPLLPEPFDVVAQRPVHKDSTTQFEGRTYAVPFLYVGQVVEVRGCAGKVQIVAGGRVVQEYPRHTQERILIDPQCYEGPGDNRVSPPPPLGKMGRRLQEILRLPVEQRPLGLYAALAEVAR